MLVVKVELHPAHGGEAQELRRMIIANDGSESGSGYGSYEVRLGYPGKTSAREIYEKPAHRGRVEHYDRHTPNVWRLVQLALNDALGKGEGDEKDKDQGTPTKARRLSRKAPA